MHRPVEFRLISYDIGDDRRRRRLMRLVEGYAQRVQYSVFEGWLTESQVRRLLKRAGRYVVAPEDSLRIYTLCGACVARIDSRGEAAPAPPASTVVI